MTPELAASTLDNITYWVNLLEGTNLTKDQKRYCRELRTDIKNTNGFLLAADANHKQALINVREDTLKEVMTSINKIQ